MKMKMLLVIMILSTGTWAEGTALFAKVINVGQNDTLNVRSNANYRAKKVAEIPPAALIGIEKCTLVQNSNWCRVYPLVQQWSEKFWQKSHIGWVNARFLNFSSKGYVKVKDRDTNCYYALKCAKKNKKEQCLIVTDTQMDKESHIVSLKTGWIDRTLLRGESHFGAIQKDTKTDPEGGYCTVGNHIEDYLKSKRSMELVKQYPEVAFQRTMDFVKALELMNEKEISRYIHPEKGVTLTWNVVFGGREDLHFSQNDMAKMYEYDKSKIYWGTTYGKGDDVYMGLYSYVKMLAHPIERITKAKRLPKLKRFKYLANEELVGYEIYWIDEKSEMRDFTYKGLVIILEKKGSEWYVVGMLRDRWTV